MKGNRNSRSIQGSSVGSAQAPVLILGTGAMASLFAARLAAAGLEIRMLGSWADGLEALGRSGVRLTEADGRDREYPVEVTSHPEECRGTRLALVLVKSYQTARAARQLSICLAEDGLALTLQNGLDNYDILAKMIAPVRVALGVTTIGATLIEPGWVRNGGDGTIAVGAHDRLEPMIDILTSAGFTVEIVANPASLLWGKLVINAAINPLTALLRVPNGELLNKPSTRNLMSLAALETAGIAWAKGIDLPYADPVAAVESVARRTASNYSSMLKDVLRGSPTEIDAINGAVVRVAETVSAPAHINRTLWALVKALEPGDGADPALIEQEAPSKGIVAHRNTSNSPSRQSVSVSN